VLNLRAQKVRPSTSIRQILVERYSTVRGNIGNVACRARITCPCETDGRSRSSISRSLIYSFSLFILSDIHACNSCISLLALSLGSRVIVGSIVRTLVRRLLPSGKYESGPSPCQCIVWGWCRDTHSGALRRSGPQACRTVCDRC
jgi:hypothetical protein